MKKAQHGSFVTKKTKVVKEKPLVMKKIIKKAAGGTKVPGKAPEDISSVDRKARYDKYRLEQKGYKAATVANKTVPTGSGRAKSGGKMGKCKGGC